MPATTLTDNERRLAGSVYLASLANKTDYDLMLAEERLRDLGSMGLSKIGHARLRAIQIEIAARAAS